MSHEEMQDSGGEASGRERRCRMEVPTWRPEDIEPMFQQMDDLGPVMFWISDEDGSRRWLDHGWLDFADAPLHDELGGERLPGVHPEDLPGFEAAQRAALEAGSGFTREYRLRTHEGRYRWVVEHGSPRFSEAGEFRGFIGTCIDIDAQKRAEEKLRHSEEKFNALLQATSQAVFSADASGMSEETARFWQELTGQSREEAADWGWLAALHPADRDAVRPVLEASVSEKKPFHVDYRVRSKEGAYRHFSVSGVPIVNADGSFRMWIGTMNDVTARVHAEQALQESEFRLRMLVESAAEFAILTLDQDGRVKSWSDGAARIFGYSESEIADEHFSILFTPEDRAAGIPELEIRMAGESGFAPDERWHVRKDGSRFFASGSASPIRGSDPPEFVKIARDVTDRKEMENALKDADRRKNEFLATLAHELRNPLAPIRSGLDLLERAGYDRRLIARTLKVIDRQTTQIVRLVDDLLDVSRITQGKIRLQKERIDLRPVIRLAVESTRGTVRAKEHRISVSLPEHPMFLDGDPTRLEQVIVNLINNAVKYTRRGGRISVSASTTSDEAVVRVTDNGVGIPAAKIEEVFEVFTQADDAGEEVRSGLGIGLSVVKGLVQLHGGTIAAISRGKDLGSEFVVTLPLAEAPPDLADDAVAIPEGSPARNGRRILVVDDNRDAVAMLQILLTMEGHEVRTAYDGEAAVEAADEFRPHVVLCDLGLPKLDGYEVARRLSRSVPEALLVAVSGWGQDEDRRRSREAGFRHHLVKPVALTDVTMLLD